MIPTKTVDKMQTLENRINNEVVTNEYQGNVKKYFPTSQQYLNQTSSAMRIENVL